MYELAMKCHSRDRQGGACDSMSRGIINIDEQWGIRTQVPTARYSMSRVFAMLQLQPTYKTRDFGQTPTASTVRMAIDSAVLMFEA